MALERSGFIVTGDDFVQAQGPGKFRMAVVGVVAYGPESIAAMHRLFAR